jgi:Ca-activated chloride channel homolog
MNSPGLRTAVRGLLVAAVLLLSLSCRAPAEKPEERRGEGSAGDPAQTVHLLFAYGSEKQEWVEAVTESFNGSGVRTASGKSVRVEPLAQGSGELIDDILSGARKPHLASPASAAFIQLGNAQSRAKTGKPLLGETRNLVLSPVVLAMWRPMAEAIGWGKRPVGWSDILSLAQNPAGWAAHGHPEWGPFRFGHTHPEYSNSGLIALLAEAYAGAGKVARLTREDVARASTAELVAGIERAVVHYGSSTGFFGRRMFSAGPQYLSAAVLYENMVIESYVREPRPILPVVAVYPREGTFWSDHPVGIVEREWVTPEHREAAGLYIDYLLARPQQERAMALGFRPADVEIQLGAPFDAAHGVDPREPQTTLEVPPVEVIEAVLELWRRNKKRSDVTLVLDTSGSMNEQERLVNARAGAEQLVTLLDPADTFSLLTFSNEARWAVRDASLAEARAGVVETVRGLFAGGGTALYDSIAEAYRHSLGNARKHPDRIAAVVVLTDGEDTDSSLPLNVLLARIRSDGERQGVRVFTIGYDEGAQGEVLESIADATQARFYAGNPGNIRTVFREISTFF